VSDGDGAPFQRLAAQCVPGIVAHVLVAERTLVRLGGNWSAGGPGADDREVQAGSQDLTGEDVAERGAARGR
jgi:hypothetical protein